MSHSWSSASRPPRLLLVDDEESVLLTLGAVLRRSGYEVFAAENAERACQALLEHTFDLIVTDMHMEDETSGFQVLAAARNRDPHAVGIVLTGFTPLHVAEDALQGMVSDYLHKPSSIETLKTAIARGLERRRLNIASN